MYAEKRVEIAIRAILGRNVVFHHTVLKSNGMTYGGLHETREGAEQAKSELIHEETANIPEGQVYPARAKDVAEWERAPIIELQEGQTYKPWGIGGGTRIHGKDDGTHGSRLLR